jgi:4-amino-4-deoxy-L-arabinose transferase-like glycosyltransferase
MSLLSDALSWFLIYQSLLLLLNAARLGEKQKKSNIIVFDLTWPVLEPTIYRTLGEHAKHYSTGQI